MYGKVNNLKEIYTFMVFPSGLLSNGLQLNTCFMYMTISLFIGN